MSKSKSQRMEPVNHLAAKKEQQFARIYAQGLAQVQTLQEQLQKLYLYRDSYNQQLMEQSRQGNALGSHRLQDTLTFMTNLNKSIESLLIQIQQQKINCENKKKQWLAMHTKTRIYNKVTEKYVHEEQLLKNKNEQKLLDEFNQSLYCRKNI